MKQNLKYNITWILVAIAGWVIIDVLEGVGIIDQFAETTLVLIGINIILATGLNLIVGFSGQFSLGHAGFMALGAYSAALVIQAMPNEGGFVLGTILGMALAGVVALIIGIPTLRLKGDYLAIATMGAAEIIRIIIVNMKITNGPAGLYGLPQLANWSTVYILVVLTTILTVNFIRSRNGRAIMAVREDEIAAESMGINTTKFKVAAFVFGGMTAAIGGALHATYIQTIAPTDFGIMESINILIIVVMGGIGSMTGTFAAAILLGLLDMVLQSFGALRMVLYSLALILIMIFRPKGLFGTWEFSIKSLFGHKKRTKEGA